MKWFFLFFVFAVTSLANFRIGPMSVRIYMTALMMIYIFVYKRYRSIDKNNRKYTTLYISFLILMTIAMLGNGEIFEMNYVNYLLGSHIPPLITFIATLHFIKTDKDINALLLPLGVTTIITSIITILQFYNEPLGWTLNFAFNGGGPSEWQDYIIDRYSGKESMMGLSYQTGIFAFSFVNAAFLCSTGLLFLYKSLNTSTKLYLRLFTTFLFLLSLTACFMTQQRAAFLGMLLIAIWILFRSISNGFIRALVFLVSLGFVAWGGLTLFNDESLGRMTEFNGMQNDSRYNIWVKSLDFLSDNILWGGPRAQFKQVGVETHNVFMNAFVYGGLFGGIVIIVLLIKICMYALSVLRKYRQTLDVPVYFASGILLYTATSIFHNCSIVNGSELTFLLLALLAISDRRIITNYTV